MPACIEVGKDMDCSSTVFALTRKPGGFSYVGTSVDACASGAYRGYCASKRVYYFGFKLHALVADNGTIVEFDFTPASYSDQDTLHLLSFDIPPKSELFADAIYCDYAQEDSLKDDLQINFQPQRKANSKKDDNTYLHNRYVQLNRKHIQTDFSQMLNLFPRKVHATNTTGFLLKIIGFIFAHNFNIFH